MHEAFLVHKCLTEDNRAIAIDVRSHRCMRFHRVIGHNVSHLDVFVGRGPPGEEIGRDVAPVYGSEGVECH